MAAPVLCVLVNTCVCMNKCEVLLLYSQADSTRGRQLSPSKEYFIGHIFQYFVLYQYSCSGRERKYIGPQSIRTWTKCHSIVLILIFCSIPWTLQTQIPFYQIMSGVVRLMLSSTILSLCRATHVSQYRK